MPTFELALKTLHRHWYCGKFFKVKGVQYMYEEADFDMINGEVTSVIVFSDSKRRYRMAEEDFFKTPKTYYDSKGSKY